ncbi:hypothetical protein [Neisseria sicca]|uniref:hypothetical protein n=1 Tax=Neisseria sicca TaxID=490 RepID=UPI0002DDB44D|nr:hypothetical protein [Neisseria sicca]
MKPLNNHDLEKVSGGWGGVFARNAPAGWALGKFVFDPIYGKYIKSIPIAGQANLNRLNKAMRHNGGIGFVD